MGQKQSKKGSSGGKKGKKGKGGKEPEPTPEPTPVQTKVVESPKPTVESKPAEKPPQQLSNSTAKPKTEETKKPDEDDKGTVADVLCEEMNKQNSATKVCAFLALFHWLSRSDSVENDERRLCDSESDWPWFVRQSDASQEEGHGPGLRHEGHAQGEHHRQKPGALSFSFSLFIQFLFLLLCY
jgi:hypothetical protein